MSKWLYCGACCLILFPIGCGNTSTQPTGKDLIEAQKKDQEQADDAERQMQKEVQQTQKKKK